MLSGPPPRRLSSPIFVGLVVAMSILFFAGGYLFGHQDGRSGEGPLSRAGLLARPAPTDVQQRFRVLWEALAEIERSYYRREALDEQKLVQGAVKGLVEAVGDPHTVFLTPQHRDLTESELQGRFDGIGVQVDLREGKLFVVAPLDGSPGQLAGLRPGDVIARVDGQETSRLSLTDAVARIRGARGTTVVLTLVREGEPALLTVPVVRGEIRLESVQAQLIEGQPIGYLRVSTFSQLTAQQLRQQLGKLLQSQPRALVLDLRGNPGGFLSAAVDVTSQFVRDGVVLYQQRGGVDGERKEYRTAGSPQAPDLPLVVLVDRGSASAAEIVAAALRENNRAILVGERTFGKGTVQELHNLSDHSQVRITVAQWLTPTGQPIHGTGIAPDLSTERVDGRDTALEAAVQYLAGNGLARRG